MKILSRVFFALLLCLSLAPMSFAVDTLQVFALRIQFQDQVSPASALLTFDCCCCHLCVCVWSIAQSGWTLCDSMGHQAPLSVGFSRQEYWSGLPFPTPRDLPHPGIKPASLVSPGLAGKVFTTCAIWEALSILCQLGISDKEMILRAGEARCIAWRVDGIEGAGLSSSRGVHASLKKHNCLQTKKKKTNLVKKKLKPQRSELLQKASHI